MEKYQLKLSNFDGPLDLLLHLISKAKIEIKDIFVSEITEQYLEYIRNSNIDDLESTSEFLEMAATLLYIKSRSLLPKERDIQEEESPEDELVRRLEEYKKYKEAALSMREFEKDSKGIYYKLPEEIIDTRDSIYINADVDLLVQAFRDLLKKVSEKPSESDHVVITQDYVSMHAQMRMISSRLRKEKKIDFFSLFSENPTRMEIAVTFYALLELISQGRITVAQEDTFGNISIERKEKKNES